MRNLGSKWTSMLKITQWQWSNDGGEWIDTLNWLTSPSNQCIGRITKSTGNYMFHSKNLRKLITDSYITFENLVYFSSVVHFEQWSIIYNISKSRFGFVNRFVLWFNHFLFTARLTENFLNLIIFITSYNSLICKKFFKNQKKFWFV
jgi:hypothetical protein